MQENFGLPTLHLETEYAESDTEQLRVWIEAYLEMNAITRICHEQCSNCPFYAIVRWQMYLTYIT
jgi:hypothetical protein